MSRENLIECLAVLEDIKENFEGAKILEVLINHKVFLGFIEQPVYYHLLIKLLTALFPTVYIKIGHLGKTSNPTSTHIKNFGHRLHPITMCINANDNKVNRAI
jgi:hypothetical protein